TGALEAAMLAVTVDPLRESSQRALIRVHLQQGNTVDAVRTFRAFRRRLAEELGVAVSSQIIDLVRPLRAGGTPARRPHTDLRTVATTAAPTLRSVPG
ncbi:bacterial transcriptional activator domain-containing protein, partial [Georgenia sp. 10Sc9-8]|nr:bacterial transcriptional activator domain-containing protein [Georgenia halotolerans]